MKSTIFTHIGKSAGTSFIRYLDHVHRGQSFLITDTDMMAYYRQRLEYKDFLIAGHFRFGVDRIFGIDNHQYVTILRDPVSRVISEFHFIHNMKEKHDDYAFVKYIKKLEDYIANPNRQSNHQTYILSHIDEEVDSTMAFKNLVNHYHFGISEDLYGFIFLSYLKFNWPTVFLPKDNVGSYDKPTGRRLQKIVDLVHEYDYMDVRLYGLAKAYFESEFAKFVKDSPENKEKFAVFQTSLREHMDVIAAGREDPSHLVRVLPSCY